jgi:hypothetical protein
VIYHQFPAIYPSFKFSGQIITIISLNELKLTIRNQKISYWVHRVATKLRRPFSPIRSSGLILQNFSVSADIHTLPSCVSCEMRGRCVLPVQSCCNLLKINQKYANSNISKRMTKIRKVSGPTISFLEKACSAELQYKWFSKSGPLWNFLFGHIPNTWIHQINQYSIDSLLYHVVLPPSDKFSFPELKDFCLIGQNHSDDPRGTFWY